MLFVVQTFVAMGVGEYISLRAIAFNEVGDYDLAIVGGVLVTSFVAIVLLAILGPVGTDHHDSKDGTARHSRDS